MTPISPSSPEPAAGWAALLHAGPTSAAQQADLAFEADMGLAPDFARVGAHPAGFVRQQLDHLSPAQLQPLSTMVEGEIAERGAAMRAGADGLREAAAGPAHQALGRAELAALRAEHDQLHALQRWIDAAVAGKADGRPPEQWQDAPLHASAWDFHRTQAGLASALVDEGQARLDLETASTPEARRMAATRLDVAASTVDGTVARAELATLHRASDSLEASVMAAWRSTAAAAPAERFAAVCRAQHQSVRALDALLLVRDLAHRYPPPAAGQPLPIGATGRDGSAPPPETAARVQPALMRAARAFDALNAVYGGCNQGVQIALGQDGNASPLLFDYGMRRQLPDMPAWNPELAGAISHEMDRIGTAFEEADRQLPQAWAALDEAIQATGAVRDHDGLRTLNGLLGELRAALPVAPDAVPRVLSRVGDLPTAAVAHAAQAFTVANPDSPEPEGRALAAENLLDVGTAAAGEPSAAQRLFATTGPAGLPIASDG